MLEPNGLKDSDVDLVYAGASSARLSSLESGAVDVIQPDSVAASAGFKVGDVVLSIDGSAIESFADMQRIVSTNAGSELVFRVKRDGTLITVGGKPVTSSIWAKLGHASGSCAVKASIP